MNIKVNANKLVSTKGMPRKEWLSVWRPKGLGGSDIAGVLNINPKYTNPLKVYISKVEPVEEESSEAAEWGTALEPVIRNKFKEKHPELKVRQSHFMWQHPEFPFMVANVDGFIYDPEKGWGVLEIKTASEYLLKKWSAEDGKIPEEYYVQAQHYLAVFGLKWGYFAALIGGNKYREFYFERDEELIESLIILEKDFWENHVLALSPPELDGSEASENLLKKMYAAEEALPADEVKILDSEAGKLLEQLDYAKEQKQQYEEMEKEAKHKLQSMLGQYQVAAFKDRKITWKASSRTNFDTKSLKKDHPEIYNKYVWKSESRRFLS